MQEKSANKEWVWDRYWQFDRVASCFDSETANYSGAFKKEWRGFFADLPEDAKILDLCTGNGAVARLAAEYAVAEDKEFAIVGVDKAAIKPEKFVTPTKGQDRIEFLGGVAAEHLPFDEDYFDAVVSQYGFEYTNTEAVVEQISEVLKPASPGKLICHAAEGVVAENGTEEAALIRFVEEDLGIYDAAIKATEAVWTVEKADAAEARELAPVANRRLDAYKRAMKALVARLKENPDNHFLYNTYGLLRHTFEVRAHFPLDPLVEKIEDARTEALAHLGRVEALLEASVSESNCRALKTVLETKGFSDVRFEPFSIENDSKLVGWNFEFSRLA